MYLYQKLTNDLKMCISTKFHVPYIPTIVTLEDNIIQKFSFISDIFLILVSNGAQMELKFSFGLMVQSGNFN